MGDIFISRSFYRKNMIAQIHIIVKTKYSKKKVLNIKKFKQCLSQLFAIHIDLGFPKISLNYCSNFIVHQK